MDRLVASKAATDDFTRTRWWWIRHAPVRVDEGRIYGQRRFALRLQRRAGVLQLSLRCCRKTRSG